MMRRVLLFMCVCAVGMSETFFVKDVKRISTFCQGPLYATVVFRNNTARFFNITSDFEYGGLSIKKRAERASITIRSRYTAAYHIYGALKTIWAITIKPVAIYI
jgi:hypothetical protein